MIVEHVSENEDGSANVDIHLEKDELGLIIQQFVINALRKLKDEEEDLFRSGE